MKVLLSYWIYEFLSLIQPVDPRQPRCCWTAVAADIRENTMESVRLCWEQISSQDEAGEGGPGWAGTRQETPAPLPPLPRYQQERGRLPRPAGHARKLVQVSSQALTDQNIHHIVFDSNQLCLWTPLEIMLHYY